MVCTDATVTYDEDGSITVGISNQLVVTSLQESLQHTYLCDVVIFIDGRSFHSHKFLMAALSNFFCSHFSKHSKEAEVDISDLKNISSSAFELFMQFAYFSRVKLQSLDDAKGLFKLAMGLDAATVKEACCEYLRSKLTTDNCGEILSFAEEFGLVDLEKRATKLINQRLIELSVTYMKPNQQKNSNNQKKIVETNHADAGVDVDDSGNADMAEKPASRRRGKFSVVPSSAPPGSTLKVETKAALKGFPILRSRRSRKPALPKQIIHEDNIKSPRVPRAKAVQEEKKSNSKPLTASAAQRDCKMWKKRSSTKELREHKEQISCSKCNRLFTSRAHLRNHMAFHNKKGVKRSSVRKKYDCSYCGKQCNYASALKVHLRTHTGQKPFECQFCDQKFTQSINLCRHVLSYHEPNAPKYQCKVCGKEFSVQIYLKSHEITHSEERPFQCEECGALFKRKNDLRSHRRVHSSAKPHQCDLCMTSFKTLGDLKTHKQIHNNSKPHSCTKCAKSFKRTGHLNRHMKIHSNEKPFKCKDCSAAFNRKENLRNHERTHTGEVPYKCQDCPAQFKHSSSLKAHAKKHWSHTEANTEVYVVPTTAFDQSGDGSQQLQTIYQASTKAPSLVTIQGDQSTPEATELATMTSQGNLTNFAGTKFLCLQNYHPNKSSGSAPQTLIPISDIGVFNDPGDGTTDGTTQIHGLPFQVYTVPKQDANNVESNTLQAVLLNTQTPAEFYLK